MPEDQETQEKSILLLADDWSCMRDGIVGVNRSLALSLTRYKGIKVFCAILKPLEQLSQCDRDDAQENNVTLIGPSEEFDSLGETIYELNSAPTEVFGTLAEQVPVVSHIVGHMPVTAEAAIKLRESLYPTSKVVLCYHVIPSDLAWMSETLEFDIPGDTELVRLAEKADVVYSVTEKMHWFYTAKFRNRAQTEIDHRLLYPQCSEKVFGINRESPNQASPKVLCLAGGGGLEDWQGLDIATCGANKVTIASEDDSETRPKPTLVVGGIAEGELDETRDALLGDLESPKVDLQVTNYKTPEDLYKDLAGCSLCVVPSRSEPFGYIGLCALSAGIPTLIAEDSALASVIRRLTSEPEYFLVPTTPTTCAVRQDGSLWRDRILGMLQDPELAHQRAAQLRNALKRDEPTKESHDNFICYCLGRGIQLKHEAYQLEFKYTRDEEKELPVLRSFNKFILAAMKQCWRLKHHPLTTHSDLFQIIPGLEIDIVKLMEKVTDKIEEYDRRIVGIEPESGSFIVYCPTVEALTDLWAMCDRINNALIDNLLSAGQHQANPVLEKFRLKKARVRTIIQGPEFLKYKQEMVCTSGHD